MKKKIVRKVFIQPADPYGVDILVCAGVSHGRALKKIKNHSKGYEFIEEQGNIFRDVLSGKKMGTSIRSDEGYFCIVFPLVEDAWWYWELLIHELHHIVYWLAEVKLSPGEMEAQAYLQEYLFREIRRKLQGVKS